jgi:diguanylate cyclase (GGDEF)-like protein
MPSFDLPSIGVTLALFGSTLTLVLWVASRDREFPIDGVRLWVAGTAMMAVGLLLNALQGTDPPVAMRVLWNVLMASAIALLDCGMRAFRGRPKALGWPLAVAAVTALTTLLWSLAWPSVRWRILAFSLIAATVSAVACRTFFGEQRAALRPAARFGGAMFLLFALMMGLRALEALGNPSMPTSLTPTPANVLTYLLGGVILMSVNASLLMSIYGMRSLQLRELAYTDSLTGVLSRRGLQARLERWLAARAGQPAALALVDGNGFKRVNDELGHEAGDELLRAMAAALRAAGEPAGCLLARVGGDEFVLLAPDEACCRAVLDAALADCERQLPRIASGGFDWPHPIFAAGLATLEDATPPGYAEALQRADAALYAHKRELGPAAA